MNDDNVMEIMDRWRPGYVERASAIESELAQLFQEALKKEMPGDIKKQGGVSSSLTYLHSCAKERDYKLVLFLYSGHFLKENGAQK